MGPTGAATAMPADIDLSSSHGSSMPGLSYPEPATSIRPKPGADKPRAVR
jgi:hypothetical protein